MLLLRKILSVISWLKELEFYLQIIFEEIYVALISNAVQKQIENTYFKKLFENAALTWCKNYLLIHLATSDTTLRFVQHKILNNVPFLNKTIIFFEY